MNKVILIGNLTRDPELQTTNSGTSVCRFGLAVQRRMANADGQREADFFNITVWGKPAESCHKYLKKGSKCGIQGRIQISSYEAQDGTQRRSTDIIAEEVEFIGSRMSDDSANGGDMQERETRRGADTSVADLKPIDDDDSLPF